MGDGQRVIAPKCRTQGMRGAVGRVDTHQLRLRGWPKRPVHALAWRLELTCEFREASSTPRKEPGVKPCLSPPRRWRLRSPRSVKFCMPAPGRALRPFPRRSQQPCRCCCRHGSLARGCWPGWACCWSPWAVAACWVSGTARHLPCAAARVQMKLQMQMQGLQCSGSAATAGRSPCTAWRGPVPAFFCRPRRALSSSARWSFSSSP